MALDRKRRRLGQQHAELRDIERGEILLLELAGLALSTAAHVIRIVRS